MPLVREGRRLLCERGHSFDIARSGYINLLQPQDRRSKHPGDAATVVAARRRLHDRGVTAPLLRAIAEFAPTTRGDVVLDVGCGDGFYLANHGRQTGFDAHGVDISIAAVDAASRRYPECEWVVANADRSIPYANARFSLLLSITGRMNSKEFRRVLRDDGRLLVGVSGPDDLIEMRRTRHDRVSRTVDEFAREFTLGRRHRVITVAHLDAGAMNDIMLSVYRPSRTQPAQGSQVTFSLDLLLFRPV